MTRALIVIDVQESFRARPLWETISNPKIADQVNRLVRPPARPATWWSGCCTPSPARGGVFDPALGHVRLIDGLAPAEGEPTLVPRPRTTPSPPPTCSSCSPSAASASITVCGIRTEQCVETTTRVGARPRLPDHLRHRRHRDLPHPAPGRCRRRPARRGDPGRPAHPDARGDRHRAPSTRWPAGSPPSAPSDEVTGAILAGTRS